MSNNDDHSQTLVRSSLLATRYESLRAQVLAGSCRWDAAFGLGTLLRFGMRAWMKTDYSSCSPGDMSSSMRSSPASVRIEPKHAQLGALIADMIIPSLQVSMP